MVNQAYLKSIYQGKKVFLTGHTGFKGAWMLAWLHLLDADVKGYALDPLQEHDLYPIIEGDSLCASTIADIRDKERVKKEILDFQPDFIFHLAAQPLVRLSYQIPTETFEVNALGTAYVLDSLVELKKPCTSVFITTDKVYENKEWHYPYRETDNLGGYDPYSASKSAAEIIIASYRNSFFNVKVFDQHQKSIASCRAGNVIGGGDWAADRIIPDVIRALKQDNTIVVRNPNAVRPWQHVLEPIGGYLLLGAKMVQDPIKFSQAWNFGPYIEDNLNVKDVVEQAILQWGSGKYNTPLLTSQPHEAGLLKLDISKTIQELGWKPRYNAAQAIEKTISWYKNSLGNAKDYTFQQINEYVK